MGFYDKESTPEDLFALAERWDGFKWSQQSISQPEKSNWANLGDVACPTTEVCMAVGIYTEEKTELRLPLGELWNGTTWSQQSIPVPEGTQYANLEGISCVSSTECIAVGEYTKEAKFKGMQPYIVKWNGTKWTRQIGGLPANGNGGYLSDVSCISASVCTAVGGFYRVEIIEKEEKEVEVEVNEGSLVDTWNGSQWFGSHLESTGLADISCPSSEACMTISYSGNTWMFSKGKWNEIKGPTPGSETNIFAISCVSNKDCVAAGSTEDPELYYLYASIWNGTEWQLQTVSEPNGTEQPSALVSISCTKSTECIAVGESQPEAIAEHSK